MRKAILSLAAITAVACGNSTATTSPSAAPPASAATIAVATNSKLGQIPGHGQIGHSVSAQYWPPLITNDAPKAGAGAAASLLGTTIRTDGTTEVTYGGHPLYYVVTDHNPGDATGQGVNNFGAPWDVVGPDGKQIG